MRNILFLLLSLIIFGCNVGYQYVTTPHYVPLNTKKGELKTNINLRNIQFGYSLTDHFSIFSTLHYRSNIGSHLFVDNGKENSGGGYKDDKSNEFSIGCSFYNSKLYNINYFFSDIGLTYECLTGWGFGNVYYENFIDYFPDYEFSFDAKKMNLFLQPETGIKLFDVMEVGFFSRLNGYNYYNIKATANSIAIGRFEPEDYYFYNKSSTYLLFLEPGIILKLGYKNLKFYMLASRTYNLLDNPLNYKESIFQVGLSLNFNLLAKKANDL